MQTIGKMLLDRKNWSSKKFSWYYAIFMAIVIILISFLLINFRLIETVNLRIVYIPVMLIGTLVYIRDFAKHTSKRIGFTKAFVYCSRTGVYTCIVLVPIIMLIVRIGLPQLGMIDQTGRFNETDYQIGFMISRLIELFSTVLITSFLGAFVPGMIVKAN